MSRSNGNPREYELPNDVLINTFALSVAEYWVGAAVGFIKAGGSSDPAKVVASGVLQRDAAFGVLAGVGVGIVYPLGLWAHKIYQRRQGYEEAVEQTEAGLEREKAFYRLSASPFNSFAMRMLLSSQAVAILGAVIASNVGSDQERAFGDYIGRAIGSLVGAILGVILAPTVGRLIAIRCANNPVKNIEERQWFKESRHDVPFYTRLFFGAWTGYVVLSLFKDPLLDLNFARDRLTGTVLLGGLAYFSPIFFAMARGVLNKIPFCQSLGSGTMEFSSLLHGDTSSFPLVRWYSESRIDMPWYARVFCGVIAAATVGLVQAKHAQEAFSDVPTYKNLFYTYNVAVMASPFLFFVIRKIVECIPSSSEQLTLSDPPHLQIPFDMPWYARHAMASLAMSMFADACHYASTNFDNFDPTAAPSKLPMVMVWLGISLATLSPMMMAGLNKVRFMHSTFSATDDDQGDLSWPWYARQLAGGIMGAFLGTAFSQLFKLGDPLNILPGTIGPEFIAVSNAVGASTGLFVGQSIGLVWPLFRYAFDKTKQADWSQCGGLFNCRRQAEQYVPDEFGAHLHVQLIESSGFF